MKTEVTEEGVIIPRDMLEGIKEVEIRKENNIILVIPIASEDPILQLGQNPVSDDADDASINHDRYIYRQ